MSAISERPALRQNRHVGRRLPSVFFYADVSRAFPLNGRVMNLEYGSYALGALNVFVADSGLPRCGNAASDVA